MPHRCSWDVEPARSRAGRRRFWAVVLTTWLLRAMNGHAYGYQTLTICAVYISATQFQNKCS